MQMKKYKRLTIRKDQLFAIELPDALGFAFGYVTLSQAGYGHLANVFKAIGETTDLPPQLFSQDLIMRDRLISDGPFLKTRYNPFPWILLDSVCPDPQMPRNTFLRVGSRIFDMRTDQEVMDETLDPYSFPPKEYYMGNRLTYEVTSLLTRKQFRFNKEEDRLELF